MNEKERIFELVRKNVISMDEALTLLEASTKEELERQSTSINENEASVNPKDKEKELDAFLGSVFEKGKEATERIGQYIKESKENDTVDKYAKEYQEEQQALRKESIEKEPAQDNESLSKQLQALKIEKPPLDERIIIINQRLRELEIFEELEDLTAEMIDQRQHLNDEKDELMARIEKLTEQINQLELKLHHSDNKKTTQSSNVSEEFTKQTTKFADEAVKEGKKISQIFGKQAKEFIKNFDMKNISIDVPWIKTHQIDHQFEYMMENIQDVNIRINNGSAKLVSYEGSTIQIVGTLRFHGQFDEYSVEAFEELSTISTDDHQFIFNVGSPRLSMDAEIKLPKQMYHKVSLYLMNGNGHLENISAQDIQIINKNGNLTFNSITSDFLNVQNVSGKITIESSNITDLVAKTLSGDIRYQGNIYTFNGETVSGNLVAIKENVESSQLKVKTVSGDIKISQPQNLNLDIDATTSTGEILHKLENLDPVEWLELHKKAHIMRTHEQTDQVVEIQAKVISGDILLKDR